MLLFTVTPVNHAESGHAKGSAVGIDGDGVRNGAGAAPFRVKVNKRVDLPFPAEPIGGIVVMRGIQAEVFDRDIRVHGSELAQGDDGADTVMSSGVKETEVQGEVNGDIRIV